VRESTPNAPRLQTSYFVRRWRKGANRSYSYCERLGGTIFLRHDQVKSAPPDWLARGMAHIWLPYTQMRAAAPPLPVVRTQGSRIYLADGRELIDGIASWWTACHGYNHPHIRNAVSHQLGLMPHVMFGGLVHEPALALARRLAALLPEGLERVFFCDSGSVAVEVAMKMAVQFWLNQGNSRRNRFVAFKGSYHGDTFGAMSVCDPEEGMHSLFARVLPKQVIAELPLDATTVEAFDGLLERHAGNLAGIIVEPLVQGAGGMLFHAPNMLRHLRAAADRHGLLLIFDEIFTGFGRTGTMFACEAARVTPDIINLSKALTGGTMGLGATVATKKVFDAFLSDKPSHALMHGPTYMANPLACAAANASLDLFEREPRLTQVATIEAALARDLEPARGLPRVRDVRVKGAIGVVELDRIDDLSELKRQFVETGVFVRPFGNIVYLTPAFTIGEEELNRLTGAVVSVLEQWTRL
jgi:adenosylmethionine---8-amino-7-oxononanoate aminotransferase